MSTYRLRPARTGDAGAVATIWRDGWRDGHLGNVPDALVAIRTPESFRTRAAERVADATVAVAGEEVAGFIMVAGDEVEQVYVAAEQHGRDADEDLVEHPGVEALPRDVGADDVHVPVARGGRGRGDRAVEVTDERDARYRRGRGMVGEHELRPLPPAAERLALALRAPVRIVTAERARADQQGADPADELGHRRVGPEVRGQPGHVAARAGDEAVQRHRRGVDEFSHESRDGGRAEKSSVQRQGEPERREQVRVVG